MPASRSTMAAAALAAGAACTPGVLFVQPAAPGASAQPALRATAQRGAPAAAGAGAALPAGVAVASLALIAGRGARAARRAAAEAEAPSKFDPATQLGAMAPLGFFDPVGFTKGQSEQGFRFMREAELKHGRVAMLAALGFVAQQYVKLPGFEKVPSGVGALTSEPGTYGFVALFMVAGALELAVWTQDPKKEVGNFGDPAGLSNTFGYDEDIRHKELNNGRFAMFAAIGILAAEISTGKVGLNQFS